MRKAALLFTTLFLLLACTGGYQKAEDAPDAAREFIRASLDGDYRRADFYLMRDSLNLLLFETQQKDYRNLSALQKENYRESSIRPLQIERVNDSLVNYTYYQSSNPKDTTVLRVVRQKGEWLIDLKSVVKM